MAKTLESEHHGHELCSTTDRDTGNFCVLSLRVRLKPQKLPERLKSPDFLKSLDKHSSLSYPANALNTSDSQQPSPHSAGATPLLRYRNRRSSLTWADAHHDRTGRWPNDVSGPIAEAPDETWHAVNSALRKGSRGLRGGLSLARLLIARRQIRCHYYAPRLTIPQVLAWAEAFDSRHGKWPTRHSGPVADAPGETWPGIQAALERGHRGSPGGSSSRACTKISAAHSPRAQPALAVGNRGALPGCQDDFADGTQ